MKIGIQALGWLEAKLRELWEWDYVRAGRSSSASRMLERRIEVTTVVVVQSIVELYEEFGKRASVSDETRNA